MKFTKMFAASIHKYFDIFVTKLDTHVTNEV